MPKSTLPDWERVLSSATRLQQILPDAVLVGGTASALYARHRLSADADHVLTDTGLAPSGKRFKLTVFQPFSQGFGQRD